MQRFDWPSALVGFYAGAFLCAALAVVVTDALIARQLRRRAEQDRAVPAQVAAADEAMT